MKIYYQNLNLFEITLFGFQALIFLAIIYALAKIFLIKDRKSTLLVLGYFFAQIMIIIIDIPLNIIPYFPDAEKYLNALNGDEKLHHASLISYIAIIKIFNYIFLLISPISIILFQKFILSVSILIIVNSTVFLARKKETNSKNILPLQRTVILLLSFYPALTIYTSGPLRDYLTLFIFSVFLYGFTQILKKGLHRKAIFIIFTSLLMMFFVRFQFVISLLIPLIYLFSFSIKNKTYRYLLLPIFLLVGFYAINYYLTSVGYGNLLSPEEFTKLRQYYVTSYGDTGLVYGLEVFKSYKDIFLFVPKMFLQFLVAPFPIMISMSSQTGITTIIDAFFIVFISIYILYNTKYIYQNKYLKIMFVSFILLTIPISIFEFFISSVPRHRLPSVIMLIVITSVIFTRKQTYWR